DRVMRRDGKTYPAPPPAPRDTVRRDIQMAPAALRRLRSASAERLGAEEAADLVLAAESLLPGSRWRIEDESGGVAIFSGPAAERRARWFCEQIERGRV